MKSGKSEGKDDVVRSNVVPSLLLHLLETVMLSQDDEFIRHLLPTLTLLL
jgi:hypothetical protein